MKQNQTRNVSSKKLRRILHKLFNKSYCGTKNSAYLCSVFHFITEAALSPVSVSAAFFVPSISHITSSVPCGALMRPLPQFQGGRQRGAELFSSSLLNNLSTNF